MGVHILENGGSIGQIFVSFSNVLPASKTDWHIVGRCLINLGEQINEFSGGGGGGLPTESGRGREWSQERDSPRTGGRNAVVVYGAESTRRVQDHCPWC